MSFPRYKSYKDSGIEWLGDVPEHWKTASLRWISKRYSGGTPDKLNLDYWMDGTIPWLNSGAVNEPIITEPSTYITEEAFLNSSAKWIPKDALVMALAGQGKTKGMVAQLAIKTTCNQSMAAIIPTGEVKARFLYWWLVTNYQNIRNMAGGDLRDGLNLELLGNIPCPLLPCKEQSTIAAFLDRETAKIDVLVAEQQRLIELLKEKRQAVISHAATKGLNHNAPMKDSGIEWLGEVPAHWELKRVRHLLRQSYDGLKIGPFGSQLTSQMLMEISNYKVFGQENVIANDFIRGERFISGEKFQELSVYEIKPGDILITMMGTSGRCAIAPDNIMTGIMDSHLLRMRVTDGIRPRFLRLLIDESAYVAHQIQILGKGSIMHGLNSSIIKELVLVVPTIIEQDYLLSFLDLETAKLDDLTTEANHAITLLQERRTAIISAAVTGKIDVRGLLTGQPVIEAAA